LSERVSEEIAVMATKTEMYMKASQAFFSRNNPLDAIVKSITEGIDTLLNFNSKMKLIRYKFMLAQQQMNNMEHFVTEGSPYEVKGHKIDRAY
jgi:hypothetical protein